MGKDEIGLEQLSGRVPEKRQFRGCCSDTAWAYVGKMKTSTFTAFGPFLPEVSWPFWVPTICAVPATFWPKRCQALGTKKKRLWICFRGHPSQCMPSRGFRGGNFFVSTFARRCARPAFWISRASTGPLFPVYSSLQRRLALTMTMFSPSSESNDGVTPQMGSEKPPPPS